MSEPGRGYIDSIDYKTKNKTLRVRGWLCLPGHSFDGFRLEFLGRTSECPADDNEDLAREFGFLPNTKASTFGLAMTVEPAEIADWHHMRVVGVKDGEDVAFNDMQFRADGLAQPLPPEELRWRVSNSRGDSFYHVTGMKTFGEFYGAIEKHCDLSERRSLLDWGCGCGRVASLFLEYTKKFDIYGCDIDAEAIKWCQENLEGGDERFRVTPLLPPTDYEDDQFDLVIGYSVCTHLSRVNQQAWLRELRRITKPGATVFLSVHGLFATQFQDPETNVFQEVLEHGISDRTPDLNLDGVAPESYYRGVFQTPEYTKRVWGEIFDVIDYIDRGMGNFHDLVVLRNSK